MRESENGEVLKQASDWGGSWLDVSASAAGSSPLRDIRLDVALDVIVVCAWLIGTYWLELFYKFVENG